MPESGLELSAALIDQTVHQAAHSVAPLGPELAQQLGARGQGRGVKSCIAQTMVRKMEAGLAG